MEQLHLSPQTQVTSDAVEFVLLLQGSCSTRLPMSVLHPFTFYSLSLLAPVVFIQVDGV